MLIWCYASQEVKLESVYIPQGDMLPEIGRIIMVQSSGNIPYFRRLFLALVFVLAIPVIIWLSSSYLTSLNKRSQAIQTSVDAQAVADQQQTK